MNATGSAAPRPTHRSQRSPATVLPPGGEQRQASTEGRERRFNVRANGEYAAGKIEIGWKSSLIAVFNDADVQDQSTVTIGFSFAGTCFSAISFKRVDRSGRNLGTRGFNT